MISFKDEGLLLTKKRLSETKCITHIFTKDHGMVAGALRLNKKQPALEGNFFHIEWSARLEEHLGKVELEGGENILPYLMNNKTKFTCLSFVLSFLRKLLPERYPYPKLYEEVYDFFQFLCHSDQPWVAKYVFLELKFLKELGYELNLRKCVATGTTERLVYVSPKSAKAVSKDAGEPFKRFLLPLPRFINNNELVSTYKDLEIGLNLTGYFLERYLINEHNSLMSLRQKFLDELLKHYRTRDNEDN